MRIALIFCIALIASVSAIAREKVNLAEEITYDVAVDSVSPSQPSEIEVDHIQKVEYAKYISMVVDAIEAADKAAISEVIVKTIDDIGYANAISVITESMAMAGNSKSIAIVIEVLKEIDYSKATVAEMISILSALQAKAISLNVSSVNAAQQAQMMKCIIDMIAKIDYSKATSAEMYKIIDIAMQSYVSLKVNPTRSVSASASFDLKWYDYQFTDAGSGLWAIAAKAKWKAEQGEDITDMFKLFLQMIQKEIETTKEKQQ